MSSNSSTASPLATSRPLSSEDASGSPRATRPTSAIARSSRSELPLVIIDTQLLARECLARTITAETGIEVVCFSTIDDWLAQSPTVAASLVVLCQTRRTQDEAVREVERLSEM